MSRPARLLVLVALAAPSCRSQSDADRQSTDAALRHFTNLVTRMASDSIGAMYLPDGMLAAPDRAPIIGPAAIQAFLETFSAYHVLAYETVPDSLRVKGDTAFQSGRWWQRVRVPAGDTVSVSGGFSAEWVRNARGEWHLRRMGTDSRVAGPWPRPSQP